MPQCSVGGCKVHVKTGEVEGWGGGEVLPLTTCHECGSPICPDHRHAAFVPDPRGRGFTCGKHVWCPSCDTEAKTKFCIGALGGLTIGFAGAYLFQSFERG